MIGVFVTFQYGNEFSEVKVRQIATGARAKFEGMPGLRSKAFTVDAARRMATNFYVWETESAAKSFFTPQLVDMVAGLYGVRPELQFVEIAALVDNAH